MVPPGRNRHPAFLSLKAGLDPREAIKAISGIGCYLGAKTCLNAVAVSIGFVLLHLETGEDLNDIIEEHDFSHANRGDQWEAFESNIESRISIPGKGRS